MIKELFEYLITPVPKYVRKIGFLTEGIGIKARWERHKKAWKNHIENSSEVIKKAIQLTAKKNTVLVIGSGSLIDVPINALIDSFEKVILLDLFHFRKIKNLAKKHPKIELIDLDVTGILKPLIENGKLSEPQTPQILLDMDVDLIISSNYISQLPLIPMDYLEEKFGMTEEESHIWGYNLIKTHLNYLKTCKAQVCLISDVRRFYSDKDGAIISMEDALLGNLLPEPDKRWIWNVAPIGELSKQYALKNEVYAYYIFR